METLTDTGALSIYSATSRDKVEQLVKVIIEQLIDISKHVVEEELERAKSRVKAGIVMGLQSSFNRCERMTTSLMICECNMDLQEIVERVEQINTDTVKNFGNYLRLSKKAALSFYWAITKMPSNFKILSDLGC